MRLVKAPLGLLEFLRLKTEGTNPSAFGDGVAGVVDVGGFYAADSWTIAGVSNVGVITAGVQEAAASVPGAACNQARRLLLASGELIIGAAAGTFLSVYVAGTLSGNTYYFASANFPVPVIGGAYRVTQAFPEGLVIPPQMRLGVVVRGNAGGADHNVFLDCTYTRLDGQP